ncbi:hypothetical protein BDC45DRAFT_577625 [Circinella umbellata]|nr:hypothetical protein BDC45DRAFT_577625 [Circinella umbellata]
MSAIIVIKLLSYGTSQNATTSTTSNVTPATAAANEDHGSYGYMEEEGEEEDDDNHDEMHIGIAKPLDIANRLNLHISPDLQKVMEITFATSFYAEIKEIIDKNFVECDKKLNRTKAQILLANMIDPQYSNSEDTDQLVISLTTFENNIILTKKTELITDYLDPVLSPIYHDPDNDRFFQCTTFKTALDKDDKNCALEVQAVAFYPFIKLGWSDISSFLKNLPYFLIIAT